MAPQQLRDKKEPDPKLQEIFQHYPHPYSVVERVWEEVGSYEKTERVLFHATALGIEPDAFMDIVREIVPIT